MAHDNKHGGTMMSSPGFGAYPDFPPTFDTTGHELLGLQAGMEMMGIPSRRDQTNHHHQHQHQHHSQNPAMWRGFNFKPEDYHQTSVVAPDAGGASSSANTWHQANRLMVDDSSLRCLVPSEGQGLLSLSLCNPNIQPEMQQQFDMSPKTMSLQQQQFMVHDERLFPTAHPHMMLRGSKYLLPAQDLLNEFVNLGSGSKTKSKHKKGDPSQWEEGGPSLYSLDLLELQKRKAKLLAMLEEVDRRYRKYCQQMRAVVSSFEAVAGDGAATVYSTLASKAMSRHFRCLRDGIVGQIQTTRKAMGEKDPVAPGTTRGETPRLRLLDQCFRQQKAFQQSGMMESHPWRPQRGLPERSVSVLRAWLFEHFLHPYPSDVDKHILARQTGLSRSQVSNWFINARVRLWKPMVEDMYMEEQKEDENNSSTEEGRVNINPNAYPNQNPNAALHSHHHADEQKAQQQLHHDADSLSSIINARRQEAAESFGGVDVDFASPTSYSSQGFGSSGNGGGGGPVSLTLGLQQHTAAGMGMAAYSQAAAAAAAAAAAQHTFFFPREHMEDCQPVQFSILEGEAQNLPYRNLMGAQLLHDLAG